MPIPTAKPTRATQRKPIPAPTIYPPTKPITSFNTQPSPTYIEPDNDNHDDTPAQPNKAAIQINSPHGLANISRQALYHVINLAFNSPPEYTIPQALARLPDCILHSINIKEVCNGVVHSVTKETITKYTKLMHNPVLSPLWVPAMSKELHRLVQGKVGTTVEMNTLFFLSPDEIRRIPKDRTVTYTHIVIDHWPQKDDSSHVRITIGGNLINYPYKLTTQTADMVSSKIMRNSIISTAYAKFGSTDIKNMYLETPLDQYKYMKMPLWLIPDNIIEHYGLREKAVDGYMEIRKGMYGLPQASILVNKLLKLWLACHGYFEQAHTPGLWKYASRPIWFNLCVDDFGIKYIGDEHLNHLFAALWTETYKIIEDWKGNLYCGISLTWNYDKRCVGIAMPTYVAKQLLRYEHPHPMKPQHCPYNPNLIKYGQDNQATDPIDTSPKLNKANKKCIQQIVGSFLYYACAVNPTILMALSAIASQQALPTEDMHNRVNQFLDYMATHPDAKIQYCASDMVLNVHSDASYLSAPNAQSCAGGYFFLGSTPHDGSPIQINGAVHVTCTILKLVAASTAEAELGALFLSAQEAKVIRLVLKELGHPQPPNPMHIDNATTVGIVNNTIKQQCSRAMEMKYFWLLDGEAQ
jgi:hypothetical protein